MYKAQQELSVGALSSAQGHCSQERVIRETPFSSGPRFLKAEEKREEPLPPGGPLRWESRQRHV